MTIKRSTKSTSQVYFIYDNQRTKENVDEDRVDAIFSRKRPEPLDVTRMVLFKRRFNNSSYPEPPIYTGNVPISVNATGTELFTSEPTPGEAEASLLLARSRLTASGMNLGESLGSAGETFGMVAKRLRQISSFAKNLRNGKFDVIARDFGYGVPGSVRSLPASKRLADGYLEVQFGWRPLMSDIYSAMEAFHRNVVVGQEITSRATLRSNAKSFNGSDNKLTEYYGSVSHRITGRVSNPYLRTLNQLGFANPLLTAWELLPFSFVIDWFLPINHILASYSSFLGMDSIRAARYEVSASVRCYEKKGVPMTTAYQDKWVVRSSVNTSISWPDLTWRGFQPSLGKVTTAIALVRQNFR